MDFNFNDKIIFSPYQNLLSYIYYDNEDDKEEYCRDDDYYADLDYRKGGVTYD